MSLLKPPGSSQSFNAPLSRPAPTSSIGITSTTNTGSGSGSGAATQPIPASVEVDGHQIQLPKVYALYFPQYHKDLFNDGLWGKGYTDWETLIGAPVTNKLGDKIIGVPPGSFLVVPAKYIWVVAVRLFHMPYISCVMYMAINFSFLFTYLML